jgi:hypothetical protein
MAKIKSPGHRGHHPQDEAELALAKAVAPIGGLVSLPLLGFPLLFTLPALSNLPAIENKH